MNRTQNAPTETHGRRDQTQDTPTETHGRRDRTQNATRRETPPSPTATPPLSGEAHADDQRQKPLLKGEVAEQSEAGGVLSPRRRNRNTSPRRQPPRAPTPLPACIRPNATFRRRTIHEHTITRRRIFASARTSALIGSRTKRNRPSLRRIISPFPCPLPEFNLQWGGKTVIIKANKRNAERHKSQRFAHREPELLKAGGEARFFPLSRAAGDEPAVWRALSRFKAAAPSGGKLGGNAEDSPSQRWDWTSLFLFQRRFCHAGIQIRYAAADRRQRA